MSKFTLIKPHVKDLGGLTVKRLLPSHPHKMVGPFIFFDHMGPAQLAPGDAGIAVRPHPHIGLATVTYLFEGAIMHRDSLGSVQEIHPGDVNWMTAGEGIAHSERTPDRLRASGSALHGIQIWIALPKAHEKTAAAFAHHPAASLPVIAAPGVHMRVVAGSAFGKTSPVATFSELFYVAVDMEAGASLKLPADYPERAVYSVDGEIALDGAALPGQHLAVLSSAQEITITAGTQARLVFFGGQPLDGDRHIWWNFVASSREAIEEAKNRWRNGGFGAVPGETEWIPLPEEPKPAESFS